MKKIAETNLYIISIDAKKNRLYQEVRGRWLVPTIGYHYEDDIDRALRLLKPGFTVLNNALKVESLMSPEWRNIAEKTRERIVQSGMKASAEVLPENALTKMQIDRISKEAHFLTKFFSNPKEAEIWLDSLS